MLDLPENTILEDEQETHRKYGSRWESALGDLIFTYQRNQTDPGLLEDGVGVYEVYQNGEDEYAINYGGYCSGLVIVTKEGAEAFVEQLGLEEQSLDWIVGEIRSAAELPDWMPDDIVLDQTVECTRCTKDVDVKKIYTPNGEGPFCRECWLAD